MWKYIIGGLIIVYAVIGLFYLWATIRQKYWLWRLNKERARAKKLLASIEYQKTVF